jgi:hypothetical protein
MALTDNRGRLFGRFNLIDAAVAVVLLGLIPLVYGAFLLFRQPQPSIESITPAKLPPHITRVQVKGRNLRPFLRVSFNQYQGTTFAFIDEQTADVDVPQLPPGTYDVILYDVAREISRLSGALTVEGPALPLTTQASMLLAGRFVGLDDAEAQAIQKGAKLTALAGNSLDMIARGEAVGDRRWFNVGELQIEAPLTTGLQVPALLRVICSIAEKRCQVGGRDIEAGAVLTAFTSNDTPVRFEIGESVSDGPSAVVELRGRFVVPTESLAIVKAGDRARRDPLLGDRVPLLITIGAARSGSAALSLPAPPGILGPGEWALQLTDAASIVDATVRLRADLTSQGLQYRGRPLRAGAPFVFEHERYVLRGWIQSIGTVRSSSE